MLGVDYFAVNLSLAREAKSALAVGLSDEHCRPAPSRNGRTTKVVDIPGAGFHLALSIFAD
jgi:hypothetical protein